MATHVQGETSTDYVAEETPIPTYFALHRALERLRASALAPSTAAALQQDESLGPQVLFIGEKESGKTSLIKTLANWAIRAGRARTDVVNSGKEEPDEGEGQSRGVMLVNLDPAEARSSSRQLIR
jgi:polyribonucleotide 5'-hydroxyl-kinase